MSETATIDIIANAQGDGINLAFRLSTSPFGPISFADSPGTKQQIALSAGNNTLPNPPTSVGGTAATLVMLFPPNGSSNVKRIKGASGDTGVANWTSQPVVIPAVTGIVINSIGSEGLVAIWL